MILLVTSSSQGPEYKAALQKGTGERVHLVESLPDALSFVGERRYSVVVIDELLSQSDLQSESALIEAACFAIMVYINFSVCGICRVVSEVKATLRRHHAERLAAMRMASSELRDELKGAITGILLSSELAMSVPELPRAAQVKIKFVHDLAQGLRRQLEA